MIEHLMYQKTNVVVVSTLLMMEFKSNLLAIPTTDMRVMASQNKGVFHLKYILIKYLLLLTFVLLQH
jgi:hypothetical protein